MNTLFIILTVIALLASVLLTISVLLQNGKGGGLASNFTTGNQTFGVRQTADILEKITWGLVVVIFVITIIASFITRPSNDDENARIKEAADQKASEGVSLSNFGDPSVTVGEGTIPVTESTETPAE